MNSALVADGKVIDPPKQNGRVSTAGISQLLCQRFAEWRYESIPPEVTRMAKLFVIDTLGVIAAASKAEGMQTLSTRLGQWDTAGRATALIGKNACSPLSAALVNGAAAHALDFDDQHDIGRVHGYCVSLPAVLATAQELSPIGGPHFILALVTGIEFHARLGLACHRALRHGWHPTTTLGTLAAAVAAGRLLRLDPSKLLNALGIAFHQAGGTSQSLFDNVLSKRLGPGFAARSAVLSAFLANDGLTGPMRPLEGDAGLFNVFERGEVEAQCLTSKLGQQWELLNYSIKPYPSCRCNHSIIDLAIDIHDRGIAHQDIKTVDVFVSRLNLQAIGGPYKPNDTSVVHAQFNAAFSFARALLDGHFDLRSFGAEKLTEPVLIQLAARVRVSEDPEVATDAIEPVRVEIGLQAGRKVSYTKTTLKGSPHEPLSESEILSKFRRNLSFGVDASDVDADRLAAVILTLETSSDAGNDIVRAFPSHRAA